ncbi:hypothetical protein CDG81_12010 [Actinopolyspora erythraea]|uniref:GntR family transcriptional regulator n=1 Tax=Actinopolyspora erythraea TaxID=414996 RepID=A0A099D5B3_9ACTN|nr:hypothetical protein [Actinopolyspora erythraea]ASU78882.1 hypothetical protein CDG81_12010 [Actinopolyspora erythraea]KGI81234.1 hypothetical protein IL38_12090 [Actinopolyspora erythraea]
MSSGKTHAVFLRPRELIEAMEPRDAAEAARPLAAHPSRAREAIVERLTRRISTGTFDVGIGPVC